MPLLASIGMNTSNDARKMSCDLGFTQPGIVACHSSLSRGDCAYPLLIALSLDHHHATPQHHQSLNPTQIQ